MFWPIWQARTQRPQPVHSTSPNLSGVDGELVRDALAVAGDLVGARVVARGVQR